MTHKTIKLVGQITAKQEWALGITHPMQSYDVAMPLAQAKRAHMTIDRVVNAYGVRVKGCAKDDMAGQWNIYTSRKEATRAMRDLLKELAAYEAAATRLGVPVAEVVLCKGVYMTKAAYAAKVGE